MPRIICKHRVYSCTCMSVNLYMDMVCGYVVRVCKYISRAYRHIRQESVNTSYVVVQIRCEGLYNRCVFLFVCIFWVCCSYIFWVCRCVYRLCLVLIHMPGVCLVCNLNPCSCICQMCMCICRLCSCINYHAVCQVYSYNFQVCSFLCFKCVGVYVASVCISAGCVGVYIMCICRVSMCVYSGVTV